MYKIGDFSRLSQVPVKTLRYYDEIGLLRPSEVDRFTGYRYYTAGQLSRLNRILLLKDLGLSLDQIGRLLEGDLPPAQLRGMLKLRQAEIERSIEEEEARLARVAALINQIEQENASMSTYDVVIKKVAPVRIASIRDVVANYGAQSELWVELGAYLTQHNVKPVAPCLTIDHNDSYKERDVDLEVCEVIDAALSPAVLPTTDRVKVRELPAVEQMACTVHHGPFPQLNLGYQALGQWAEANGYRFVGPSREVYLQISETGDESTNVAEIQIPVEKA
ncbi:MAG TPA: MerR family transcriptional regulator [Anaerolineae bacterium]|nr:MerR family transcriptional regulator [Anaerolineae bacterium]